MITLRLPIALLFASTSTLGAGSQCTPAERVVFSCALAHAKVVSICLVKPSASGPGSLAYRFGPLNRPELVFPDSAAGSLQQFRYAHYSRFQVDRSELSFANGGADYTAYDFYEGDEKTKVLRGIRVSIGEKEHDLPCVGSVVSRLPELEKLVPCDAENALASCR